MFSIFSKLISAVWGGTPDEGNDTSDNPPVLPERLSYVHETREFSGTVTHLHNGYGLIDSEVYFSFDTILGAVRPSVGCLVHVVASRASASSGWRADRVTCVSDKPWTADEECVKVADVTTVQSGENTAYTDHVDLSQKTADSTDSHVISNVQCQEKLDEEPSEDDLIGIITKTSGDTGFINETIPFHFDDVVSGYVPYKGDWVTVKVIREQNSLSSRAENVQPLRQCDFEGEVNSVQEGFGYVNSEIYFTFSVCQDGYLPRRRDKVCGQAVETSQGRCQWRAVSLMPQSQVQHSSTNPGLMRSPSQGSFIQELLRNKDGITITEQLELGTLAVGAKKTISVWCRNGGSKPQTYIGCIFRCHNNSQFSVQSTQMPTDKKVQFMSADTSEPVRMTLRPGRSLCVKVDCHARNLGSEKQLLIFNFENFKIGRYISVEVCDSHEGLVNACAPYQRRKGFGRYKMSQNSNDGQWVIPGERPNSCRANIKLPNRLPQYPVPSEVRECIFQRKDLVQVYPYLGEKLSMENYTNRFTTLLNLEEVQMEIDIREFDLERVCMRNFGEFIALKVPGLAEGRPSVMIGDKILISVPGDDTAPRYEGFVHEVFCEEVLLKFHPDFHLQYNGEDYDVIFTFNRTPLRRNYQAVNFAPKLGLNVIFPETLTPKIPLTMLKKKFVQLKSREALMKQRVSPVSRSRSRSGNADLQFYNKYLNTRQRAAVSRILQGQSRPLPYILFGPPGTGKTVTLVEAILQVFHQLPDSRIIACTPSNSAADLLVERLHDSASIRKVDMVRLNAFQRVKENIPECVQPYCQNGDNLDLVARYRIIVCTCSTAGTMYSVGLKSGHFTHVFIDEAGQATEPECMVAVGLVAGENGHVVLAGDPMQLGPVLRSKFAKMYGLDISYLERLISTPLYARDEVKFADHGCYDPLLVTKLVENYRSHPVLIDLSSRLFYHDELVVSANKDMVECLCQWPELPNKRGFPLVFHGIRPKDGDMREGNSPSWFNPVEAVQVMKYLQALVNNPVHKLSFDDIGVITPYRKQVEKIRLLIDRLGLEKVKVGSVEEFQGQERLVMIISTVRSNEALVNSDLIHNLGFLCNSKRFNVAITRAQALLIIVGNPHILAKDHHWEELLRYCIKNNAYIGCDLPDSLANEYSSDSCPDGLQKSPIEWKRSSEELSEGSPEQLLSPEEEIPAKSVLISGEDSVDKDKSRTPLSVSVVDSCVEGSKTKTTHSQTGEVAPLQNSQNGTTHHQSDQDSTKENSQIRTTNEPSKRKTGPDKSRGYSMKESNQIKKTCPKINEDCQAEHSQMMAERMRCDDNDSDNTRGKKSMIKTTQLKLNADNRISKQISTMDAQLKVDVREYSQTSGPPQPLPEPVSPSGTTPTRPTLSQSLQISPPGFKPMQFTQGRGLMRFSPPRNSQSKSVPGLSLQLSPKGNNQFKTASSLHFSSPENVQSKIARLQSVRFSPPRNNQSEISQRRQPAPISPPENSQLKLSHVESVGFSPPRNQQFHKTGDLQSLNYSPPYDSQSARTLLQSEQSSPPKNSQPEITHLQSVHSSPPVSSQSKTMDSSSVEVSASADSMSKIIQLQSMRFSNPGNSHFRTTDTQSCQQVTPATSGQLMTHLNSHPTSVKDNVVGAVPQRHLVSLESIKSTTETSTSQTQAQHADSSKSHQMCRSEQTSSLTGKKNNNSSVSQSLMFDSSGENQMLQTSTPFSPPASINGNCNDMSKELQKTFANRPYEDPSFQLHRKEGEIEVKDESSEQGKLSQTAQRLQKSTASSAHSACPTSWDLSHSEVCKNKISPGLSSSEHSRIPNTSSREAFKGSHKRPDLESKQAKQTVCKISSGHNSNSVNNSQSVCTYEDKSHKNTANRHIYSPAAAADSLSHGTINITKVGQQPATPWSTCTRHSEADPDSSEEDLEERDSDVIVESSSEEDKGE